MVELLLRLEGCKELVCRYINTNISIRMDTNIRINIRVRISNTSKDELCTCQWVHGLRRSLADKQRPADGLRHAV